jgi:hypothetical protein
MNIPGFDAESSLGPTMGIYRGKVVSGRLGTGEVLPMQEFLASSTLRRNLDLPFLGSTVLRRTITCCRPVVGPFGTHPLCKTYEVPFFEDCKCLFGAPVCTPRVLQNF